MLFVVGGVVEVRKENGSWDGCCLHGNIEELGWWLFVEKLSPGSRTEIMRDLYWMMREKRSAGLRQKSEMEGDGGNCE